VVELLEAGYDLAAIAACFVAIGFLLLVSALIVGILKFLDVGIGPYHPFHGITTKAENAVTASFNTAIQGLEKQATKFESGLVDAFTLIVGIPLVLAVALFDLLKYLWNTALSGFVHGVVDPVRSAANTAITRITTLTGIVADNLSAAKNYAEGQASSALSDAKDYASHWIDNAVSVLNGTIRAAIATAEGYADTAIAKLRSAEDAAVAAAVGLAVDAKNAGINAAAAALGAAEGYTDAAKGAAIAAAAGALTTAESYADAVKQVALTAAGGALVTAEDFAAREADAAAAGAAAALAQAEGVVTASVDAVRSIAIDVQHDLGSIEGAYGALGVGALIASIPALATLVNAIASEAGLENSSCRSKVKGICGTDPLAWGNLLAGIAAIGIGFDLGDIVKAAIALLGDADELLAKVGELAQGEIDDVGQIIGEAALAIAA
jgi:hypothetical protein